MRMWHRSRYNRILYSLLPLIRIFFKHLCSSVLDLTLQILRPGTQSGPIYCVVLHHAISQIDLM